MKIVLATFGKLRTPGLRETVDYYLRNLKPWVDVQEIELKPISVPDKSEATRSRIQEQEGELLEQILQKRCSPRLFRILLHEEGKNLATSAWADWVRKWERDSTPEVAFCIGSSLGFGISVRSRANLLLSLGSQTLSHDLARAVLAEQLYRAWSVTRGHPYHVEG